MATTPFDWGDDLNDVQVNQNPDADQLSQNPGATGLGSSPPSISGALADYANRPQAPGGSLDILMDDQQMRDAGVHPDQSGAAPDVSVIDATGAGDQKADPAGGYAKAAGVSKTIINGMHNAVSGLVQAPTIAKGVAAGASSVVNAPSIASVRGAWQTVQAAAGETAKHPAVAGLKVLNKVWSVPLSAAEGVARGAVDRRNGASWPDTIVGNVARTGLVGAAGMIPYVGWAAAPAANGYLPDGAVMGQVINQSLGDPDRMGAVLEEGF
jgi:hypothetical protein